VSGPDLRYACVDVGSNTTRLFVAEAAAGRILGVVNERAFTLIGQSVGDGGRIPAQKISEVAGVVARQVAEAHRLGAERVRAVATAAIRRAANAAELAEAVERRAGIPLEVLSGEEEARLAFRGAANAVAQGGAGPLAVFDVGGGSTELAIGGADGVITHAESVAVGSSTVTDRHLRSDPPAEDELKGARVEVARALAALELQPVERVVAVGGSASSLERVAGDRLGPAELAQAMQEVLKAPAAELADRYSLDPERARLLPAGLLILSELSARLGEPLRVCKGGLREGVILEMAAGGG
jgi:exopolyphosphatase/guanosine-5'-triphosphate,3'-diphosphate pyrophosphatase